MNRLLSLAILVVAVFAGPAIAGEKYYTHSNRGARWYNANTQWHGAYAHNFWKQPTAMIAPPTAGWQSTWSWVLGGHACIRSITSSRDRTFPPEAVAWFRRLRIFLPAPPIKACTIFEAPGSRNSLLLHPLLPSARKAAVFGGLLCLIAQCKEFEAR